MSLVDVLIWVVLLIFAVKGFMKGMIREVCSLLGIVIGGWAACYYYIPFAAILRSHFHFPHSVALFFSFGLIFVTSGLVFFFLGHLLTTFLKIILLGGFNRIGGLFLGFVQGAFVLSLLLTLATVKSSPAGVKAYLEKSASARPFIVLGKEFLPRHWNVTGGWGEKQHERNPPQVSGSSR
jgi:membrane protein required for colicin V production